MKRENSEGRTDKILSFLKEIEKYKTIERKIPCSKLDRPESDAEHSWHMAMFLILFEKDLPATLDMTKMLKLALIHDLAEIYAGDPFTFDEAARINKKEREAEAAKKLFSQLPCDLEEEMMELFNEYEECATKEAKIVRSFDKIQPILQNLCSEGKSWKDYGITYEMIDGLKRKEVEHNEIILEAYEKLMKEGRDRGLI